MNIGSIQGDIISHKRRLSYLCLVCLINLNGVLLSDVRAGNIFDDDWVPPKRTIANQPPSVLPEPVPPTTIPSNPTPKSPTHRELPAKLDLVRSRALLKETFAAQLKDRTASGRRKLAQALLDEVSKAADNPTDQYVLLGGAIEASKEAGAVPLCFEAADIMAAQYELDALNIKVDAALKMNLGGESPIAASDNVKAVLELIDPLIHAEEFASATRLLALSRAAAKNDVPLTEVIQKRSQVVEVFRTAHEHFSLELQKLKVWPENPAANLAVGSYLCFNKGEWDKGLSMLAKSSDANLKQLAAIELSRPTSMGDLMVLGDRWWDIRTQQPGALRGEIGEHAASFYRLALVNATGLRRTLMEHRIIEASEAIIATAHGNMENFTNSLGIRFVHIEAGKFLMGTPPAEAGRFDNEILHTVIVRKPFLMATTTVTQAQWKAIMGTNPSHFPGDDRPVEMVSWDDAVVFCEKLSTKEAKHYRLPTEAEWEYACRAGTQTAFGFSDGRLDDFAWYGENSGRETHAVATKKPNRWGLYDMLGNVFQWCSDEYGPYGGNKVDPKSANATSLHILRGGGCLGIPRGCRAGFRSKGSRDYHGYDVGIRLCLDK